MPPDTKTSPEKPLFLHSQVPPCKGCAKKDRLFFPSFKGSVRVQPETCPQTEIKLTNSIAPWLRDKS